MKRFPVILCHGEFGCFVTKKACLKRSTDCPAVMAQGSRSAFLERVGVIFRAYPRAAPLTRKSAGLPIGSVAGFLQHVAALCRRQHGADAQPHCGRIFDKGATPSAIDMSTIQANAGAMPSDHASADPLTRTPPIAHHRCRKSKGYEADLYHQRDRRARPVSRWVHIIRLRTDLIALVGGASKCWIG